MPNVFPILLSHSRIEKNYSEKHYKGRERNNDYAFKVVKGIMNNDYAFKLFTTSKLMKD